MDARYYIDPGTDEPHIYGHGVNEREVEDVLDDAAAVEDQEAFESTTHTAMEVPVELVPEVRNLIAKRRAG